MLQITPATADQVAVKWLRSNIPTEGTSGNWVLASGSDVQHLTMAVDGTLYAYGKSLTYTLYKSTDAGFGWSYTGKVTGAIVDIATSPGDASIIYYATTANVYQSTNAGRSFASLPSNPGGAGSNNVAITAIAVAPDGIAAVATRDTDNGQYGGVYTLDESESFIWVDTAIGNYDVYALAYSIGSTAGSQLVAVATDEADTIITSKVGGAGWGNTIGNATITGLVPAAASLAFPHDYAPDVTEGANILFAGIDGSGSGDVYKLSNVAAPNSSVATDLNIGAAYSLSNVDVTSLATTGEASTAHLMAGVGTSAQVYFSSDGGANWTISAKPPTGQTETYVLMTSDFTSSGRAYAATTGTESAVSYTLDGGATWNQVSLIDTTMTTLVDLAPSPDYETDNTLFLLSWGGEHSLWRSLNGGSRWERMFSSAMSAVDSLSLVGLPPQYGNDNQIVFLAGESNSNPVIWKSTDNGQTFSSPITTKDPATGNTFDVDIWAIVNDTSLFIGSFDSSNGLVYRTTNSGLSYSTAAVVGSQLLNSIVLSPNYEQDETILTGNTAGWIYWSNDNGGSFETVPPGATSAPLTDSIAVAFDSQFGNNHTVYAASDTADSGIYRFIIGNRTAWESIDGTLPTGGTLKQLIVSAGGTMYATNFNGDGGMERSLNPTYPLGPTFESVTSGLDSGATLNGLWLGDNRLWATDTTNIRLMTYTDSLTVPVTPTSPPDKASGIGTIINYTISNAKLDWETLTGATNYSWQLNYVPDFSSVPTGFQGTTRASAAQLPSLAPATTYYWRVRATEPVLSPWAATWSFTTSLGDEAIAPKLVSPAGGTTGVSLKPIFQWGIIAGADKYEFIVSTDINFNNPTVLKSDDYALPSTAWQCNTALEPETTYYWKVRAISADTYSAWSAVGAFATKSAVEPLVTPAPAAPQAPPPSSSSAVGQLITTDWALYLFGGLLLTIILLIVVLLVVVIRLSRI